MVFVCQLYGLTALQPYVRPTSATHMNVIFTHNTDNYHLSMDRLFRLTFLRSVIACSLIIVLLIDFLS